MKVLIKHTTLVYLLLLLCLTTSRAQEFKIINAIPHLPVFTNRVAVPSPSVGMIIFNNDTNQPEIYTGTQWIDLFNATYTATTTEDYFVVKNGIPYLPSYSAAKLSDGTVPNGTMFFNTTTGQIEIWISDSWNSIEVMGTQDIAQGDYIYFNTQNNVDGFFLPILDNDPTGCSKGALYINSTAKRIKYNYDDTNWNELELNSIPQASGVTQNGSVSVGGVLTGQYLYTDSDPEGTSTFKWYQSDNQNGTPRAEISGQTAITYTNQAENIGKYIGFSVTPVAQSGPSPGLETVATTFAGPIGANTVPYATNVTQTGTGMVGQILTGSYDYNDDETDNEATTQTLFSWYRANDNSGTGEIQIIEPANEADTYTLIAADIDKYIRFSVTPYAQTGSSPGAEVKAPTWIGPVAIAQSPPEAQDLRHIGICAVGETITANYTYYDAQSDAEGSSTIKWYYADDASGTNRQEIAGATSLTYAINGYSGKYLTFSVTPVALSGTTPGTETFSEYKGPILPSWNCGNNFTITHYTKDGAPEETTITYGTRYQGNGCWLLQSLGATSAVSSSSEVQVAWYYQFNNKYGWKSTNTGEGWFGTDINENSNWTSDNDPCQALLGTTWVVPTTTQWQAADINERDAPYSGDLKLTLYSGILIYSTQAYNVQNQFYWSSQQVDNTTAISLSWMMLANEDPHLFPFYSKVDALPIRCFRP